MSSPLPRFCYCKGGKGFTLTELLAVIAIVGILAAIIIPVVAKTRTAAQKTTSASNLRQVAIAYISYSGDNKGLIPRFYWRKGPQDLAARQGYNPADVNTAARYYLGDAPGPSPYSLHRESEMCPVALRELGGKFKDKDYPGYYTTTSYWPNNSAWGYTNYMNDLHADGWNGSAGRISGPHSPSKLGMLGIVSAAWLEKVGPLNVYLYAEANGEIIHETFGGTSVAIAFFDGHVEWIPATKEEIWKRMQPYND